MDPEERFAERQLKGRERFIAACKGERVDRPPIWLMRQAGRYLPEYRALRQTYSFRELIRTPELACSVTMQPIKRFGFDAAILFSDIFVVAEALGVPFDYEERSGITLAFQVRDLAGINKLRPEKVGQNLRYVAEAIQLVKSQLAEQAALIGFSGAPWTLAVFLIQGHGGRNINDAVNWALCHPYLYSELAKRIAEAVIIFAQMQLEAGIDAFQLFDTLAGFIPADAVEELAIRWDEYVLQHVDQTATKILFAKDVNDRWDRLVATGATGLGVSHSVRMSEVMAKVPPHVVLQGNLDPALLCGPSDLLEKEAKLLLEAVYDRRGYIFNLGHGVPPDARLESIQLLVDIVRSYRR